MKYRRFAVPSLFVILVFPLPGIGQETDLVTPQLPTDLLLDSLPTSGSAFGRNGVVEANSLRNVLFFSYLASGGETFDFLEQYLAIPPATAGSHIRADLSAPGIMTHNMWLQEGYPWLKSFLEDLQANMPTAVDRYDFAGLNPILIEGMFNRDIRLMFDSSYAVQLEWRTPPLTIGASPGFFLEFEEGVERYAEKGISYLNLLGNFGFLADPDFLALGIPLQHELTLFVVVPSRSRDQQEEVAYQDYNHLERLFEDLDSILMAMRAKMTTRLVEARLPSLRPWTGGAGFDVPAALARDADFSSLLPHDGVLVKSIGQSSTFDLSEDGIKLSAKTRLSMFEPERQPNNLGPGKINKIKLPGWREKPRPLLPAEFVADQPHIMILADDALNVVHAAVVLRTIDDADRLRDSYGIATEGAYDWTASTWFGWLLTDNNLADLRPWYYHATHGWIYLPENIQADGTWWWDGALGWSFASATSPYIYSSTHGWLWYARGDAGSRMFYSFLIGDWWTEAQ